MERGEAGGGMRSIGGGGSLGAGVGRGGERELGQKELDAYIYTYGVGDSSM